MNLLRVSREVGEFRKRYKWMALGVSLAFAVLLARIVYLQVFSYHELYAAPRTRTSSRRSACRPRAASCATQPAA